LFTHVTVTHNQQNRGLSEDFFEIDEKWELYINSHHIVDFYRKAGSSYTLITLINGDVYGVQQTPEELYAILKG